MFSKVTLKIIALMCAVLIMSSLLLSSCSFLELLTGNSDGNIQNGTDSDSDDKPDIDNEPDTDDVDEDIPHTHTVVTDEAIQPTCTEAGATAGKHCSSCGEIILEATTVPATGHTYSEWTVTVPPTETESGTKSRECQVCHATETGIVASLSHDHTNYPYVTLAAVSPTCTSTGLTEGKKCSGCDEVLVDQEIIPALEHSYQLSQVSGTGGIYAEICTSCAGVKVTDVITYSAYGAVGDGVTDDFYAIYKAHNAANYYNLPVKAEAGATYYIGAITKTITVKTDTDWCGATFIFDDYQISYTSSQRSIHVFSIMSDYSVTSLTVPSALAASGLTKGQTNIGFAPGEKCMLLIENSTEKINARYGVNSSNGDSKKEMIIVDANGNVDPSTPIQYNYSKITSIKKYSISDKPISVGNAKIITKVPDPKAQNPDFDNTTGAFYSRGILVQRSNVTLYGVEHSIVGEDMTIEIDRNGDGTIDKWGADKSYGVTYDGFFKFKYCYGTTFDSSVVQGHQAYSFWQGESRNEVGNYDIYASYCVDLTFRDITQYENEATGEVITNRFMYHGIMGSTYCRNFALDGCYMDRFDSHAGIYNATITDTTLGFGILVIGGGTLLVEDSVRLSGSSFITLRTDYNGIFDGDVIIRNCEMTSLVTSIISSRWIEFYNGLPCQMTRSVTIEGLTADSNKIYIFNISSAAVSTLTNATNPLFIPEYVKVSGVKNPNGGEVGVDVSKFNDAFATITMDIHQHSWSAGEVITEASTTGCGTGTVRYVCTDPECGAVREGIIKSQTAHGVLRTTLNGDGSVVYVCDDCGSTYVPSIGYSMNGTDHNAMEGVANSSNFTTASGTENPYINENGEYELLKKNTADSKQFQLWLPSKTYTLDDLSDENNAIGFLSFRINAYSDKGLDMTFVDMKSNEGADRWKANGCIVDKFFVISAPKTKTVYDSVLGNIERTYVYITGWDGLELKTVDITDSENKFTGWFDVKMIIELENDTVTVHYYIDGVYVGTGSRELTTKTNSISGIYINGKTTAENSGIILSDVAFGCSFGERTGAQ